MKIRHRRHLPLLGTMVVVALGCSAAIVSAQSKSQKTKPKKPAAEKTRPGGANQIEGIKGKIGDVLFDGKWRFQVLAMETPATVTATRKADVQANYAAYNSYAEYDLDKTFKPKEGYSLVVFRCRVKNGVKENRALYCVQPFTRTAIADQQGTSYPPIMYDMAGSIFQSRPIVQGASLDFAVVFALPEGTKPKDLIFTLRTIAGGLKEGNDARVSLVK